LYLLWAFTLDWHHQSKVILISPQWVSEGSGPFATATEWGWKSRFYCTLSPVHRFWAQ
jgi:hypothetical protein